MSKTFDLVFTPGRVRVSPYDYGDACAPYPTQTRYDIDVDEEPCARITCDGKAFATIYADESDCDVAPDDGTPTKSYAPYTVELDEDSMPELDDLEELVDDLNEWTRGTPTDSWLRDTWNDIGRFGWKYAIKYALSTDVDTYLVSVDIENAPLLHDLVFDHRVNVPTDLDDDPYLTFFEASIYHADAASGATVLGGKDDALVPHPNGDVAVRRSDLERGGLPTVIYPTCDLDVYDTDEKRPHARPYRLAMAWSESRDFKRAFKHPLIVRDRYLPKGD